jgi:hypothetical protein
MAGFNKTRTSDIYINQKKGNNSREKACLCVSAVMPDHGLGSRIMLEKDFWDVSSMKHGNGCGLWPILEWWVLKR